METEVMAEPPEVAAKIAVPPGLEERVTVWALVVGLP